MTDPFSVIFAAIPSLANAGVAIAKASKETDRNSQLIDFQKAIIGINSMVASVQAANQSLQAEKRELEQQIATMENWNTEKQRYQARAPFPSAMVYAVKKSEANGEPAHYLCAQCYQGKSKSFLIDATLSPDKGAQGRSTLFLACNVCGTKLDSGYSRGTIERKYAEEL